MTLGVRARTERTPSPSPRLSRLLALAAALLLGCAPAMPADAPPLMTWPDLLSRPRPAPDAAFSYGTDPYQRVDWWQPAGAGPFPTVVMVHGGCWTTEVADRHIMDWAADDLRRHGIAVWNIDYRGVDRPGGGYPGTFADTAAAADLLAVKGPALGADLRNIVAVGHSAGGHLALWLAGRSKLPHTSPLYATHPLPIAGVVSLGGLPDLAATAAAPDNGCGTEVVAQLVGLRADPYADTSVPRLLPLGVPQALIHGADDRIIPARLATGYRDEAARAGDRVTLTTVPHSGHVELIAPGSAAWEAARAAVLKLLPETGRGTTPAKTGVVEGARVERSTPFRGPSTTAQERGGPPPRSGED